MKKQHCVHPSSKTEISSPSPNLLFSFLFRIDVIERSTLEEMTPELICDIVVSKLDITLYEVAQG